MNRVEYKAVNIGMLQELAERDNLEVVDKEILIAAHLISHTERVKILGEGVLKAKLTVTADAFSKSAKAAIEAAGGTIVVL